VGASNRRRSHRAFSHACDRAGTGRITVRHRLSAEQYQKLMRNVKTNKYRAAREVIAQYVAEDEDKRHA
jgi:hypothetical protein